MWEIKTIIVGGNAAEFGCPRNFVITYCRRRDLTVGSLFRIVCASNMIIFVNSNPDLHYQGRMLEELDGQTQGEHLGKNLMTIS